MQCAICKRSVEISEPYQEMWLIGCNGKYHKYKVCGECANSIEKKIMKSVI